MWPNPKPNQPLSRPHFSPRQLVTADDLNAGVAYLIERTRRHNRYLHGCGVVCGLELTAAFGAADSATGITQVAFSVGAGAAIGPQGDMITVPSLPSVSFTAVTRPDGSQQSVDAYLRAMGTAQPASLYLLLRHAGATPAGGRPTFPDDCRELKGLASPTRLQEEYAISLATELPPDCAREARLRCRPLLDSTMPEHLEDLLNLLGCDPPDSTAAWVVLGTVDITRTTVAGLSRFTLAVHYRDRSLLPSARALMELLACFPERPRIDDIDVVASRLGAFFVYRVHVSGAGLAPLVRVAVEGINDQQLSFQPNQQTDRLVTFDIASPLIQSGTRAVRLETDFDAINSADCGVQLRFPTFVIIEPAGGGVIGGDVL